MLHDCHNLNSVVSWGEKRPIRENVDNLQNRWTSSTTVVQSCLPASSATSKKMLRLLKAFITDNWDKTTFPRRVGLITISLRLQWISCWWTWCYNHLYPPDVLKHFSQQVVLCIFVYCLIALQIIPYRLHMNKKFSSLDLYLLQPVMQGWVRSVSSGQIYISGYKID